MRNYVRKTNRLPVPEDLMLKALEDITRGKKSFRQAAAYYNLKASTLSWRLRNIKFYQNDATQNLTNTGLKLSGMNTKQSSRQVFTMDQEKVLAQHLLKCSQLCYDLNMNQIREFAYSFAVSLNRKVPESWMINQSAGRDWARSFMKRHRCLSFGKRQNISNFEDSQNVQDYNMDTFYENLGVAESNTSTRMEAETEKDEVFLDYSIVKEEYAVQEDAANASPNKKTLDKMHQEALQFVINEMEQKKHKCSDCDEEFCYISDLKRHSIVHESEKLHCPNCPRAFVNQMSLKRHLITHADSQEPQSCGICGKMFKSSQSLKAHLVRHSSDKKYECEKCGKKFRDKQDLKRHIQRIHHGKDSSKLSGKTFTCHCCKTFYNKTLYDRHLVTHSEIKDIACPICSNKFKSVLHLRSHLLVHSNEKPFVCRICKMAFKKKSILKQHVTTHTGITPNCPYCKIPLRSAGGVRKHIEISHRGLPADITENFSADKPIACTICSKVCKNLEILKDHVKIHPPKQSSSCDTCDKTFIDDEALKRHQKHKHENSSRQTFSCEICGRNFQKNYGLQRHMVTHKSKRPRFSCKICGIQHVSKYNLQKHELMHKISEETLGEEHHQTTKIKIEDTEMVETQVELDSVAIKSEPE